MEWKNLFVYKYNILVLNKYIYFNIIPKTLKMQLTARPFDSALYSENYRANDCTIHLAGYLSSSN